MKRLIYIFILIVLCSTTACTRNGGDIGHLFGQWRLEYIANNTIDTSIEPCDTVFWAFQSDICDIRFVNYNSYDYRFYTSLYEHYDNVLKIRILSHMSYDIITPEDTISALRHLAPLHIDNLSPLFEVKTLNNKEMILEYNHMHYYFKKLN